MILFVVSIISYYWVETSHIFVRAPYYEEKLAAANWMKAAMDTLRQTQYARGVFPDQINDPNLTALIGQQYTQITTDIGDMSDKWTALNPNMAAVFISYFKEAGLVEDDYVVAGMTGSLPGMNLAFYAACEVMKLKPIVITSVGASSWGANDPYFTWLDMEHTLMNRGLLHYRSIAASFGGGEDLGRRLSPEGRELIRLSTQRNDVYLIEVSNLDESVEERIRVIEEYTGGAPLKLYVNIGGGLASIGHASNGELLPAGLIKRLPLLNYPRRGVLHLLGEKGIPILHIYDTNKLADTFGLPKTPLNLPKPGEGNLFIQERYNLIVTSVALLLVLATLFIVLIFDRRTQRLDREGVDPDTLI